MIKVNQDIKDKIKQSNLYQYQIADQMGIAETTLVRWLRYELTEEKRKMIEIAINELSK